MIGSIVLAAVTAKGIDELFNREKYEEMKNKKMEEWRKLTSEEQTSRAVYSVMNH